MTTAEVAYFSMEIALDPAIPTYAGGLGVLAGDTLRSAADLGIPMVGVTLVYRKGYFTQHLDAGGNQGEDPAQWRPEDKLELMRPAATVMVEDRPVTVRTWRWLVRGQDGNGVPVYCWTPGNRRTPRRSPPDGLSVRRGCAFPTMPRGDSRARRRGSTVAVGSQPHLQVSPHIPLRQIVHR